MSTSRFEFDLQRLSLSAEESRVFLQARLAFLGKALCLIVASSFVFWSTAIALSPRFSLAAWLNHPGGWTNLVMIVIPLVVWRLCSGSRKLAPGTLTAIDAALGISLGLGIAIVGFAASFITGAWLFPILGFTNLVIIRAALVPSSAGWTLIMSFFSAVPVVVGTYFTASMLPSPPGPPIVPRIVGSAIAWCCVATSCATLVSRVIYGLRARVRQAEQLGQYTLLDKIGEGGMGAVYRAKHAMLRRPTAIKLLHSERSQQRDLERFEREVQLTSGLTHPNTVAIYDYGHTSNGVFYYAMEYLDGPNLKELVDRDGPQSPARVIHILMQTLDSLAEAHTIGLVHRDIKPANIILCERGGIFDTVKVLDFGLVKDVRNDGDVHASQANTIVGTPHYMAPESIKAPDGVDARADLYALAAVGYFLLTGREVFPSISIAEICAHHLHTLPVPPSAVLGKTLPVDLESILLRCLAKDKDARPKNAAVLRADLASCRDAEKWTNQHARSWWEVFRGNAPKAIPAAEVTTSATRTAISVAMDSDRLAD